MKKVIICYDSRTGNTEKMANFIAEGVRFCQDYGRALSEKLNRP